MAQLQNSTALEDIGCVCGGSIGRFETFALEPNFCPSIGDAAHRQVLYQDAKRAISINDNDLGPPVGRRAGSVEDYSYSPALKAPARSTPWIRLAGGGRGRHTRRA
jgi:hypothetical protein